MKMQDVDLKKVSPMMRHYISVKKERGPTTHGKRDSV